MSEKSVPIWQVAEEFEKSIRGHETEIVAKKGDLQAQSQELLEKEKRLELRSVELDNRKRALDELEKGLQEQKEQSDRIREQLKSREARLEGMQDELETIRVRLEQKDKELAEMEKSLLEVLKRSNQYEEQLISALAKGKEHDGVMHQLEKEMRSAMETVLKVRQENLARESLLLEQAQAVSTAKGIVVEEQKRFMTWDARVRGRERAFDRTAETLKQPVKEEK
ncbi:MAG: hypothetical protein PHW93_07275 [Candidatus Methanomethylophilaceae archaeon]|nr:hypothetical protein [Candidatus Methanomethylophilaceae archaeon]